MNFANRYLFMWKIYKILTSLKRLSVSSVPHIVDNSNNIFLHKIKFYKIRNIGIYLDSFAITEVLVETSMI